MRKVSLFIVLIGLIGGCSHPPTLSKKEKSALTSSKGVIQLNIRWPSELLTMRTATIPTGPTPDYTMSELLVTITGPTNVYDIVTPSTPTETISYEVDAGTYSVHLEMRGQARYISSEDGDYYKRMGILDKTGLSVQNGEITSVAFKFVVEEKPDDGIFPEATVLKSDFDPWKLTPLDTAYRKILLTPKTASDNINLKVYDTEENALAGGATGLLCESSNGGDGANEF